MTGFSAGHIRPFTLGLSLVLLMLFPLQAQDNETCETCHDDPEHKVVRYGIELSLYVTSEHLADSPHADFACVDCHTELEGVDDWPHRQRQHLDLDRPGQRRPVRHLPRAATYGSHRVR